MSVRLQDALRVQRGDVVAFVGAGGKTSALFRLGHELREAGWRVLATTTTRIARYEVAQAPFSAALTPDVSSAMVRQWLDQHGFVFLYSAEGVNEGKIIGLASEQIAPLVDTVTSDVLLIEADGARRLPFKAPHDHEPVIPPDASLVVPVAGVDALGQPLDQEHVYNARRIQERYGFPDGAEILPPWMGVTIRDPELGLRGVPASARVVALLNKVSPDRYYRLRARRVAEIILRSPRVEAVALGAIQSPDGPIYEVQRRVSAIVLAGGVSSRMGQSKLLLPWDDRPIIASVVSRLLAARIQDIVVVTGHEAKAVTHALQHLPVRFVHNPAYAEGEMLSSLQAGLGALDTTIAACLVVLGDVPTLDGRVISDVMGAYAEGPGSIVVPHYRGMRGHPVLFDRKYWPELQALEQGAPRDVVRRYPDDVALVAVQNDSILRDVDTPEQYKEARRLAGLPRLP